MLFQSSNCDPPMGFRPPFRASGSLAPIVVAFLSGARFFALIAIFSCSNVHRGKRRTGLPRARLVPCRPAFGVQPCARPRLSENRLVVSYPRCQNERTRIMGRHPAAQPIVRTVLSCFNGLAQVQILLPRPCIRGASKRQAMMARIYKPARTAMQSGAAKTKEWVLEYEPEQPRQIEPLMGWTSSGDMRQQVQLRFESPEEAIAYCERHGIAYQLFKR